MRCNLNHSVRIGIGISGTFTDVALEQDEHQHSVKILTAQMSPEAGVYLACGK